MKNKSSNNKSLTQDRIIVLKAKDDTVNSIIQNQIYASANKPKDNETIKNFVLIGHTDALGTAVWALGNIDNISKILPTSKLINVFNCSNYVTWNWEYTLSNIYDLRPNYLVIEDIFLPEDLQKIKTTVQFTYVNSLKDKYNSFF